MTIAVLAEKPSVARDIARVLGAGKQGKGCLRGNGYVVTWAIGHLVALGQPHEIKPEWRRWRIEHLPMIPERWPLAIGAGTRAQFDLVSRILNAPEVEEVICATDAGREGELIFRYIYEASSCRKPVRRLWISSLTPEAIRDGFAALRPGRDFDPLAAAARGRSRADWLVGMNLSRAYTLAYTPGRGNTLSVGRVQTPSLAMLVERELAIQSFVPEDYREVIASFALRGPQSAKAHAPGAPEEPASYQGVYVREPSGTTPSDASNGSRDAAAEAETPAERALRARRLPADGEEAERIAARALTGEAEVESTKDRRRSLPPPPLYDLTELQRHANRLFGYSAKKTLEIAQALYERKKLLSYPRTDSRHLSRTVADTLPDIVRTIADPYRDRLAPETGRRPLGPRYVNDARVSDHHALIPTTTAPGRVTLNRDEERIYDLVCRRLLAAWHQDHVYSTTTVMTRITNPPRETRAVAIVDRYRSTGTRVHRAGWKVLDPLPPKRSARASKPGGADLPPPADPIGDVDPDPGARSEPSLPSGLEAHRPVDVQDARSVARRTRPPRPFSEATLLTAMETAGKTLDDKELSDAMRASGLGTPATRAAIIETLLARGYVQRQKKSLRATDKGVHLIEVVHSDVKSPAMTGRWEARLRKIEEGTGDFERFMREIESYVRDVVRRVGAETPTSPGPPSPAPVDQPPEPAPRPTSGANRQSEAPRAPAGRPEPHALGLILESLRERDGQSTGRLHRQLFGSRLDRRSFEQLIGSLVGAGLITQREDRFERDGRQIHFRRAYLTPAGRTVKASTLATLQPKGDSSSTPPKQRQAGPRSKPAATPKSAKRQSAAPGGDCEPRPAPELEEALRAWRSATAARQKIPAFRILTDRVLRAVAAEAPRDESSLLAVKGIGPTLAKRYGEQILAIVRRRR